jgi:hypothetical protein
MASTNRYYFTLTAGQNAISSAKLVNVQIYGLRRSGVEVKDITESGDEPVGNQFKKPFSSSIITFDPLLPGNSGNEIVWVLTKGESPPEPPPVIPTPEIIAGQIRNLTYPLTGNKITGVTYDGVAITPGSYPGFGPFSFPVEASPSSQAICLFKVMAAGVNKLLVVSIITTSLRQIVVSDSDGIIHFVNDVSTGNHTVTNVSIDGTSECLITLN